MKLLRGSDPAGARTASAWRPKSAFCGLVLGLVAGAACCQGYPAKRIIFVSPFPPGGGNDLISRTLTAAMTKNIGQSVIVENRPGAETVVGELRLASQGIDISGTTPERFKTYVQSEIDKWARVIKFAGGKLRRVMRHGNATARIPVRIIPRRVKQQ